ncbi:MAG TPA: hypothetical protein PKE62_15760 [Anaerolineales bacterium]|nr:hypothetical protein [Anaerolineales bacterium]
MYSKNDVSQLLEILLPQYFDSVIWATQDALREIDPSWKKGQFKIFSKHFRLQFWRSISVKRFLLNDAKHPVFSKSAVFERLVLSSQKMSELEKAAFYGDVLSEYVLLFPEARFPSWAEDYREKPNWLAHWDMHSSAWQMIYR